MYVWALAEAQVMCSAAGRKAKGHGTTVLGDLTLRETELLRLLATEGLTNRGLGERLGIAFRAQKPRILPVTRSFFELLDLLRLRGHDGDRDCPSGETPVS